MRVVALEADVCVNYQDMLVVCTRHVAQTIKLFCCCQRRLEMTAKKASTSLVLEEAPRWAGHSFKNVWTRQRLESYDEIRSGRHVLSNMKLLFPPLPKLSYAGSIEATSVCT